MRIGVDVTLNRKDVQRLQKLDRALDRFQRKAERHIKGIGDFIGMTMVGIGAVSSCWRYRRRMACLRSIWINGASLHCAVC